VTQPQYRAQLDGSVTFGNGGRLAVEGFRVDVPGPEVTEDEVAALFVGSLGLLMADQVQVRILRVFPEAHKGTRGGPMVGSTGTWLDSYAAVPASPGPADPPAPA